MARSDNRPLTLRDVSEASGVSEMTVSRVLRNRGDVSAATRERVLEKAKELGYVPTQIAGALASQRVNLVAVIIPSMSNMVFPEVMTGISQALDDTPLQPVVGLTDYSREKEEKVLYEMLSWRPSGVIIAGLEHSEATYQLIARQGVASMALWNYRDGAELPCIGVDNDEAGRMAVGHLLGLGHRDIGLIFPDPTGNDRARGRMVGAEAALRETGIEVPENWRLEAPYSISEAKRGALRLLGQARRPTAVLCGNDIIAQGVLYAAKHLGLGVPEDLSVMGIGEFKGSSEIEPSLSTIRIPAKRIGTLAADHIAAAVTGENDGSVARKCRLRVMARQSTGPVGGAG